MAPGAAPPVTIRIVSSLGDIRTGRVRRSDIVATRQGAGVISLKAGGIVSAPPAFETDLDIDVDPDWTADVEMEENREDDEAAAQAPAGVSLAPDVGDG